MNEQDVMVYDVDYIVRDPLLKIIYENIDKYFPDGTFVFADLGGGNGVFSDRVLNDYPKSTCILLDNSTSMISKNLKNPRKTIICDSIFNSHLYIKNADIIFLNFILHHLISDTYHNTYKSIIRALQGVKNLSNNERPSFILISEMIYDGFLLNDIPSHIIYHLSSNKILAHIIRFLKRWWVINKNIRAVAGEGVFFLSQKKWEKTIKKSGYNIVAYAYNEDSELLYLPSYIKIILHLGRVRFGFFWISQ